MRIPRSLTRFAKVTCAIALISAPGLLLADSYSQINLVSNVPGLAATTDPNLINPWGESNSATSPFWISNQGSGTATLYNGAGVPTALVVTIPAGGPPSGPTGQVFNNSSAFLIGTTKSNFIFDTLSGTIAAWNGAAGTTAVVMDTTPGAVYTGLAQGTVGTSTSAPTYLYAANSKGNIQVFDSNWNNVTGTTFAGKFVDPNPEAGFVPFNIQLVGSNLYVTYADLSSTGAPLPGGYVDVYDTSGNFIERFATGGPLEAPWGVTLAPSEFGTYSNDLLIGNFGNGDILAYNPTTMAYVGTLDGSNGMPLDNAFLWSLETRTGGTAINPDAVYFTAGINNQTDGLFGEIVFTPEPSTFIEAGSGLIALALARLRRRQSA
jgi:uncharacterized protein (TIGR03118 family)